MSWVHDKTSSEYFCTYNFQTGLRKLIQSLCGITGVYSVPRAEANNTVYEEHSILTD